MTPILLTGAQGQVGQAIAERAKLASLPIVSCSRQECDITNNNSLTKIFEKYQPRVIINCAGFTQVDKAELPAEKDNAWVINAKGPENLAKLCEQYGCLLIHLSTDYVFDGLKKTAYVETDETHPVSFYGESKLAGENAIIQHLKKYIILRVSWVFSEYAQNPLKNLVKLLRSRTELSMVSDQIACPTYAGDIAELVLTLAQRESNKVVSGIYHYCNYPAITRFDLAKTVCELLNLTTLQLHPILTSAYPTPAMRPKNSVLNCDLITKTYGISIKNWMTPLKKSLEKIV